ncbi:TraR/DksA C4-type zinc finger protein [Vibrio nigripulchritudo]|uniref:TraR/DksA C4-type zinc finger protein n=1 Tax=Vibrio nigripulchritudo TaxID=28173 RepID=UPI0003B1D286|nr:TraR/DksA C4-type zinc finger protein [Vibrio nigripulchritudo]CCN69768.1 putative Uncharacterized 8.5 kDa protein in gpA 5'region [Vibrio nigripulchritudo SFn118]
MTDQLDKAKVLEQGFRDAAIKAARHAPKDPEQWIEHGVVRCLECATAIPKARLDIRPDAAYCVTCKSKLED